MNPTVIYCADAVFIILLLGAFVVWVFKYVRHAEESGNIPAEFRSATLTVLVGQHDLQPVTANGRIELFTPRTTIGSDQNNHIVVMDNGVAPKQGEILWKNERWWYMDKSGAGTLIRYDQKSHEKTLQRARHELSNLDEIVVGPVCLRFDYPQVI